MTQRLRVIVTGYIAQYPLGGVCWDYIQYVLGLTQLGHDVYYIEDSGQWPFNPVEGGVSPDCRYNVRYLADVMSRFGLADRWAYCFPHGREWFGISDRLRNEIIGAADLLINVSGSLADTDNFSGKMRLAYIDSDPVFTQIKLARGQEDFRRLVDSHDVHFTFGETLGALVPQSGHDWIPTRQPIVLSQWRQSLVAQGAFTTIMNWTSYKPLEFDGVSYGQKDIEFMRFLDLPQAVAPIELEIAVAAGKTRHAPKSLLDHKGWRIVNPDETCANAESYRNYIENSTGEWSVAKNGYVSGRSGWFSCRSACYLAAGKPVVVQDTGFSTILPVGTGLLTFTTFEQAVEAIKSVTRDYERHSRAARSIAEEYFDSNRVLTRLLSHAGCR